MQGIYYLELDNKFYIGRATDIEFRINRHHQLLLRKTHPNPKIVKAWEAGGCTFNSGVVEACDKNLSEREMFWITEFDAINSGLNMSKTAHLNSGCVTLVAPGGELVPVGSAADICREFRLDNGAISKVIHGKLHAHKGWTLYKP